MDKQEPKEKKKGGAKMFLTLGAAIAVGVLIQNKTIDLNSKVSKWRDRAESHAQELDVLEGELNNLRSRPARMSKQEALETIPQKYGIDNRIVNVILSIESSGGNMKAINYAPNKLSTALKVTNNQPEARMLASAHCMFQVLGLTARHYKVHWSELYDPEVCTEVAMKVWVDNMKGCVKDHKIRYDQIKCAARKYNGSGAEARAYSEDFMVRLSRELFEEINV